MALSYVTYTGDGSTTNFTFDKGYMDQSDVAVYVDGVLQTVTTDYTWFNATTVQLNVAAPLDDVVRLDRTTDKVNRAVDFQDAANLTEADLDASALQLFYIAQEAYDDFTDSALALGVTNTWDADNSVIENVPTPVNDNDAANKAYVDDNNASSNLTAALAAQTAAEAALDSFDDRYLGAKASDPALDNDGDALITGAIYFNTSDGAMRLYDGAQWSNVAALASLDTYTYIATASQTAFTGSDDNGNTMAFGDDGVIGVTLNGAKLREGATHDYTLNSSTNTVTLNTGATVDDLLEVVTVTPFSLAEGLTQTSGDARYVRLSEDLSDIFTPTKGNVLVGNGTEFVEVGVGSNDQVLTADSTESAGVKWATGSGGFSSGQTWQDVSASRTLGVTYQNTTGAPIQVSVQVQIQEQTTSYAYVGVGTPTTVVSRHYTKSSNANVDDFIITHTFIVPDNWYYKVVSGVEIEWVELR